MKRKYKLLFIKIVAILLSSISYITVIVENSNIQRVIAAETNNIIPKPLSYEANEGEFILDENTTIYVEGNNEEETEEIYEIAEFIREKLTPSTGFKFNIVKGNKPSSNSIILTTINSEESMGNEGYKLISNNKGVQIIAYEPQGISRGVQTLRQLLPPDIDKSTVSFKC